MQSTGQSPSKKLPPDTLALKVQEAIVAVIEEHQANYRVIEKDVEGESSEGGFISGSFDGKKLRKLSATYYGETGKVTSEYYLYDDNVIFALVKKYNYNKPMYLNGSKTSSAEEDKYYFKGKKTLLTWLHNNKRKSLQSLDVAKVQTDLIKDAELLRKIIGNCNFAPKNTITKDTLRCKYGADCASTGFVLKGGRTDCGYVVHVVPRKKKKVVVEL
nr:hypothetical protein [Mucilaginibacter sp. L294]